MADTALAGLPRIVRAADEICWRGQAMLSLGLASACYWTAMWLVDGPVQPLAASVVFMASLMMSLVLSAITSRHRLAYALDHITNPRAMVHETPADARERHALAAAVFVFGAVFLLVMDTAISEVGATAALLAGAGIGIGLTDRLEARRWQLVDSGHLGDVHYLYGNRLNLGIVRKDENALWSLGPHDISVMLHIVQEPAIEVSATGASYLQEGVEDVVFGRILFKSGTIGHLHLSWLDPHKMRRMTVIGSERMVVFDDMETDRKITVYDKGPVPRTGEYGEYIQVRSGDIFSPKIDGAEPLRLVCQHFLDSIRSGEAPIADGWAGLATVAVLEAMDKSLAENGRPVTLEGASQ